MQGPMVESPIRSRSDLHLSDAPATRKTISRQAQVSKGKLKSWLHFSAAKHKIGF